MPVDEQLRRLPELEPPTEAWCRIAREARRDRRRRLWRRAWPMLVAGGLTATAAALAVTVVLIGSEESPAPLPAIVLVEGPALEMDRLQSQSRALEQMLKGLPPRPATVNADQAAAISALEDRIAQVDWALSRAPAAVRQDSAQPALWRERVGLMGELVRARYTQAGVAAY